MLEAQETMLVGGLSVLVTRKRVKNINLRVRPDGQICVSAPPRTSSAAIERFVYRKQDWIRQAQARQGHQSSLHAVSCVSGQTIWLWGEPLTCRVQAAPKASRTTCRFSIHEGQLVAVVAARLCNDDEASVAARNNALEAWLRRELRREVEGMLDECQSIVGKSATALRVRRMVSRWGSCNVRTGCITLSTQLVHHDRQCLRYVLIHELCHLIEPSHNDRFHRLMDGFCPNWREVRALLNG